MQVKVYYTEWPPVFDKQDFTIDVINVCPTDTLTIVTAIFGSPALVYTIKDKATDFLWTDKAVISDNGLTNCGAYGWEITQIDKVTLTPIAWDSTIFIPNIPAKSINVFSNDFLQAGTYPMRVKVWFDEPEN